jgi:hypothetical protein
MDFKMRLRIPPQAVRLRSLPPFVLAVAIVPTIAGCGQASTGLRSPTGTPSHASATSAPATPSPTATPSLGWTEVAHFTSANGGFFFASLSMPPGWTYVPSGSSDQSDALIAPQGELHMGGPTAMSSGETCSDYVQTNQVGGFDLKLAGEEPITVGGVRTTEDWYTGSPSGTPETLFSIPVESDLTGCVGIEALTGSTPLDHQTMDQLFDSIVFHPNA